MNKNIIVTIGPETCSESAIKFINKYCDIYRLNGSHNTINWHESISKIIKLQNTESLVLLDIPGVKPRTLNKESIKIKKNEQIIFSYKKISQKRRRSILISNKLPKINSDVKSFTIEDGQYNFVLEKKYKDRIIGKSLQEFILQPNKGLNIPNSIYDNIYQEKQYKSFLQKAKNVNYDAIGLSFVQNESFIVKLKKSYKDLIIVSKIENLEGLKNINSIINHSDAIMIDRGDLAAEIGNEELFDAIIKIMSATKTKGKPIILATENLSSMVNNVSPNKSEVISLGLNKILNSDKIMLSEETAISKNWKNTIKWLSSFLLIEEKKETNSFYKFKENKSRFSIWSTLKNIGNIPIVIFSRSGLALIEARKIKASNMITVFTDSTKTFMYSKFWKNVQAYKINKFDKAKKINYIINTLSKYKKSIFFGDKNIALIYILNPKKGSRANSLSIINKNDLTKL